MNKFTEQGKEKISLKELTNKLNGSSSGTLSQRYKNNEINAMLDELQRENKVINCCCVILLLFVIYLLFCLYFVRSFIQFQINYSITVITIILIDYV